MSNGLALMSDKETWSIWDHITGKCFRGAHKGKQLEIWPMYMTTVEAALHDSPDITLSLSGVSSLKSRIMRMLHARKINRKETWLSLLPFQRTMSKQVDSRLQKMAQGLGVMEGDLGKYYPMDRIAKGAVVEDQWLGRPIKIDRSSMDGVPKATWLDTGEIPMQLLSRWYGFSFTFPDCEIY